MMSNQIKDGNIFNELQIPAIFKLMVTYGWQYSITQCVYYLLRG